MDCLLSLRFQRPWVESDPPADPYYPYVVNSLYRYYDLPFMPAEDMHFTVALHAGSETQKELLSDYVVESVEVRFSLRRQMYVRVYLESADIVYELSQQVPAELLLPTYEADLACLRRSGWFGERGPAESEFDFFQRIKHATLGWIPPEE